MTTSLSLTIQNSPKKSSFDSSEVARSRTRPVASRDLSDSKAGSDSANRSASVAPNDHFKPIGSIDILRPGRPDAAARMKRAQEAATHDAWFRAKVEAGMTEADNPATEWVPHSQVMTDLDNRITRYEKALVKGAK